MSCSPQSSLPAPGLLGTLEFERPVLQTLIDILNKPRVRECPQCRGTGLLTGRLVCPACQGYGKTP